MHTHTHRQSYDIDVEIAVKGTSVHITSSYDLKNPNFRYMSGASMVPGTQNSNPTESYFDSVASYQQASPRQGVNESHLTAQPLIGLVGSTRTMGDNTTLMNGGIPSPPSGHVTMNPSPYQQIPVNLQSHTHMNPMSQTVQNQHMGSMGVGYSVGGSPNQLLYSTTSIANPNVGGGVVYRYQQLQPASQNISGVYHTPYMGSFRLQQGGHTQP